MNVVINASNLHVGGGVQVAVSFLSELSKLVQLTACDFTLHVIVSTEVDSSLNDMKVDCSRFDKYEVINTRGILSLGHFSLRARTRGARVCFTIFGPDYFSSAASCNVVGFAQPWIAYPKNFARRNLSFVNRVLYRCKFYVQRLFFKRADVLVVETEDVRRSIVDGGWFRGESIVVVPNCVSSIYYDPTQWWRVDRPSGYRKSDFDLTLGFLGRGYAHKNLSILADVQVHLEQRFGIKCSFLMTLSDREMLLNGLHQRHGFFSVGGIDVQQCPSFYALLDGVIFPSLLECFSVTPLEAFVMNKPLFASNLSFVKDVCQGHGWYFDPLDALSIAHVIATAFKDEVLREEKIASASDFVRSFPDARDRAKSYLRILGAVASRTEGRHV